MKLATFAMLRNEIDIVPTFLAHLGALFDYALLMDHGSSDGTGSLLAVACDSRPGWRYWAIDLVGNHQQVVANFALRWLLDHTDADFVLPLDADEFIDVPDREALQASLRTVDGHGLAGRFHWRNCMPIEAAETLDFDTPLLLADAPSPFPKAVVPRTLARAIPDIVLGKGAHVIRSAEPIAYRDLGNLLHVPFRSQGQFCRKIIDGALGNLCRTGRPPGQSAHIFALLATLADGDLDQAQLQRLALCYAEAPDASVTASPGQLDVAHEPLSARAAPRLDPYAAIARTLSRWHIENVDEVELDGNTLRAKQITTGVEPGWMDPRSGSQPAGSTRL